ncbi:MAG: ABC-F family ATP-binding cassette domain-containing protein [Ruminococcaceae bacterium]|nr:ABC-F family ATP-binding cassette domain-containing protein [Oscillospiraceae bacterium]
MLLLTASDVSVSFGTDVVLEKVSFSVAENDRLGVIGVNGCGKSTLLKLICGEMEPTSGSIHLSREKTIGILRQDDAFLAGDLNLTLSGRMLAAFPDLLAAERRLAELEPLLSSGDDKIIREYTALHESFLSSGGLTFRSRADATLAKLGFDEETRKRTVGSLSGGQRTRLALAVQLVREPDLLLLDEPTNHLDVETMGWLENYLLSYSKCFIAVSHDRYFLDRVTTKTLHIEHHGAKLYAGGYTASMEQRRIDREIAERHWKNQQREIARQEAYIAQQRAWNRERNIIAAESRQKLLDKMERVERPKADAKGISMRFTSAGASGNDVLSVRGLTFGYVNTAPLFTDLNFTVKRLERIFVVGPNGCGKSTLVKLLLGKLPPSRGVIEPGYHVEIGYYDQENQNLTPENTVLDELWNAYPTRTETEIRSTLGLFRFTGDAVFRTVSVLSGGERARLTLAKLMLSRKNFLLLDEPTNHLDIDSREALGEALSAFDGTIFVVSHDRYLIEKLATRILLFQPPFSGFGDLFSFPVQHLGTAFTDLSAEIAARQNGAVTGVSEKESKTKQNADAPTLADVPAPSQKERYLQAKQSASAERKRKSALERLHAEAQRLENEIAAVEEELYGSAAADYARAAELDTARSALESQLMEVYEELEELE